MWRGLSNALRRYSFATSLIQTDERGNFQVCFTESCDRHWIKREVMAPDVLRLGDAWSVGKRCSRLLRSQVHARAASLFEFMGQSISQRTATLANTDHKNLHESLYGEPARLRVLPLLQRGYCRLNHAKDFGLSVALRFLLSSDPDHPQWTI